MKDCMALQSYRVWSSFRDCYSDINDDYDLCDMDCC